MRLLWLLFITSFLTMLTFGVFSAQGPAREPQNSQLIEAATQIGLAERGEFPESLKTFRAELTRIDPSGKLCPKCWGALDALTHLQDVPADKTKVGQDLQLRQTRTQLLTSCHYETLALTLQPEKEHQQLWMVLAAGTALAATFGFGYLLWSQKRLCRHIEATYPESKIRDLEEGVEVVISKAQEFARKADEVDQENLKMAQRLRNKGPRPVPPPVPPPTPPSPKVPEDFAAQTPSQVPAPPIPFPGTVVSDFIYEGKTTGLSPTDQLENSTGLRTWKELSEQFTQFVQIGLVDFDLFHFHYENPDQFARKALLHVVEVMVETGEVKPTDFALEKEFLFWGFKEGVKVSVDEIEDWFKGKYENSFFKPYGTVEEVPKLTFTQLPSAVLRKAGRQ